MFELTTPTRAWNFRLHGANRWHGNHCETKNIGRSRRTVSTIEQIEEREEIRVSSFFDDFFSERIREVKDQRCRLLENFAIYIFNTCASRPIYFLTINIQFSRNKWSASICSFIARR